MLRDQILQGIEATDWIPDPLTVIMTMGTIASTVVDVEVPDYVAFSNKIEVICNSFLSIMGVILGFMVLVKTWKSIQMQTFKIREKERELIESSLEKNIETKLEEKIENIFKKLIGK